MDINAMTYTLCFFLGVGNSKSIQSVGNSLRILINKVGLRVVVLTIADLGMKKVEVGRASLIRKIYSFHTKKLFGGSKCFLCFNKKFQLY